jgi:hypothetical protein
MKERTWRGMVCPRLLVSEHVETERSWSSLPVNPGSWSSLPVNPAEFNFMDEIQDINFNVH